MPTAVLLLLVVGGSVLVAVVATDLIRRFVPEGIHQANNEVAGFMFAGVAVVYGVLLAFVFLVVWQQYEDAQMSVEREANIVASLFRLGQELPEPYSQDLQNEVSRYAQLVVDDEWQQMAFGKPSEEVAAAQEALWTLHRRIDQAQDVPRQEQDRMFDLMENLGGERRIRLLASRSELPTMMWILLWGGAVVTLSFTLLFRISNYTFHLLMTGLFAGLVAFVLFLTVELDSPFTGSIYIHPTAFDQALELFKLLGSN